MPTNTTIFDSALYLDSDEAIGAYLKEAMATSDPDFVAYALDQVARAGGTSQIAQPTDK